MRKSTNTDLLWFAFCFDGHETVRTRPGAIELRDACLAEGAQGGKGNRNVGAQAMMLQLRTISVFFYLLREYMTLSGDVRQSGSYPATRRLLAEHKIVLTGLFLRPVHGASTLSCAAKQSEMTLPKPNFCSKWHCTFILDQESNK